MHVRDRWIIDNSNQLLAIWTGTQYGGTFATIKYAEKKVKANQDHKINIINPNDL
jgi:uncharacterized phage-like protein YoqJ